MYKIFINFLKKYAFQTFIYVLILIVSNLCLIYQPLFLSEILSFNSFVIDKTTIGFIVLSILTPIIFAYKQHTLRYITNLMYIYITNEFIYKVLHKDVLEVKKQTANYIVRIINNFSWLLSDFYLYILLDTVLGMITALIMTVLLAKYNLIIAMFIVISHVFRAVFLYLFQNKIRKSAESKITHENKYLEIFNTYVTKLKSIITRVKVDESLKVLEKLSKPFLSSTRFFSQKKSISYSLGDTFFWIINYTTIFLGLFLSKQTELTIVILPLIFSYSQAISQSLQIFSGIFPVYSELKANYDKLQIFMQIPDTRFMGTRHQFHSIGLKDLEFQYDDQRTLFSKVNMTLTQNHVYVVKGENGSGKSTFLKILSGLYPQYKGEIFLDDVLFKEYDIEYYFKHLMTILTQDDLLFEGSIKSNLFCNDEGLIQKVSEYFALDHLDKMVLENGSNLSGGEKRRILLTRAFINIAQKNPSLVLFDEPTYALEKNTIPRVIEEINKLSTQCIVVVISHGDFIFENEVVIHLNNE